MKTSRERPKSALYLKLKIVKGRPFGLCETPAGCKIWKKLKGSPLGTWKNFPKKILKWDFWTVSQCRKMYTEAKRCFATHDEDIISICVYIYYFNRMRIYSTVQRCSITSLWHSGQHLCRAIGRLQVRISQGFWLLSKRRSLWSWLLWKKTFLAGLQCTLTSSCAKRGTLGDFLTSTVAKCRNKWRAPFCESKKFQK